MKSCCCRSRRRIGRWDSRSDWSPVAGPVGGSDPDGHLRNTASLDGQNQTTCYPDALGERFWTVHYDTPAGPQASFYSYSDGLRPEVVQEPTWTRPDSSAAWEATGVRTYVLGPLPDERLIYRAAHGQV